MSYNWATTPVLSICIPAYNRPTWLKRAVLSVINTAEIEQFKTEIVISDDSTAIHCRQLVNELLPAWKGRWQYCANSPSLGMAANWNRCIQMATGTYVLLLHDDDYLEADALRNILKTLQQNPDVSAFLFDVNVVTAEQKIIKRQSSRSSQYFSSEVSLERILTNSSFIRFPGMVIKKKVFESIGYFDEMIEGIADIHMWVRICSEYGLLRIPILTANYTVHANALTMEMFTLQTLKGLEKIFDEVNSNQLLPEAVLQVCKTNYFHQFVLAGTVRYLKARNFEDAKVVLNLLNQLNIQHHQASTKWKLIKLALNTLLFRSGPFTFVPQSNEV